MPKKLERCVKEIKKKNKKGKYNPYAVCKASIKKNKRKK